MKTNDYSELTREIYHKQHMLIANDLKAMDRFINMFTPEYFGVNKNFFRGGRKILDAGCGDTAKVIIAMHRLGSRDITGFDLGNEFIPVARESLRRHGIPQEDVTLTSGNLLSIPFPDETFDFVICHGVLVHLNILEEVTLAFSELARVTKKNGYLYTVYGIVGGLLEDAIIPALRKYYRENHDFKNFIDTEMPEDFHRVIDFISESIYEHEGEEIDLDWLKPLFDVDFSVFLKNLIQAPVRLRISEEFIVDQYRENGFSQPKRLRRYVKRKNIRRFFAPLHYSREKEISSLIYGSGNLEFLAQKNS